MTNKILKKKWAAIEEFKQRVLNSKFRNHIAKIILFGSVLKKEAHKDSDIDIMIFSADKKGEIENFLDELSFDIWWKTGERIEKLIYPVSEIRYPHSWLAYRTLKIGKEIYSMKGEEIKKREQIGYAQLSGYFVRAARENLDKDLFRASVDLAYNGAELAVKGLLLFKLDDLPSTHGGTINRFGELFVRVGEVEPELGRRLNLGLEKRNRARYVFDVDVKRDDAEEMIKLAEELLNILESSL